MVPITGTKVTHPISCRLAYVFRKMLKTLNKRYTMPHAPSSEMDPYVKLRQGVVSVCL